MNEEERISDSGASGFDAVDEHTTAPHPASDIAQPAKPEKWEMPKPVFKKTSGVLPQGWIKQFENRSIEADAAVEAAPAGYAVAAAPAPALEIEPQPELPEDHEMDGIGQAPAAPAARSSRFPLLLIFAVTFIAFVLIILAVIYFFFFYTEQPGNNF